MKAKVKQLIENNTLSTNSRLNVFSRNLRYLKFKDVKRAYSKLIQDYLKGLVTNEDARTTAYILAGYIQSIKTFELEERVQQLEKLRGIK